MVELIIAKFHDPKFMTMMLAAIAAVATVLTLAMPLLSSNTLSSRMRAAGAR
jgi:tight adherence protein C